MTRKVIVGLSGGVDSSVAALLLHKQGYDVEGLFMKNWEDEEGTECCQAEQDANDARAVSNKLGIPFHTVNFSKAYWNRVFQNFLNEYQAGRTPNPDILCNKEIKFRAFLEHARTLGADYIATGHYVQTCYEQSQWLLKQAQDRNKDQSYFLYTLNQAQLAQSLFPNWTISKNQRCVHWLRHIA